MEMEVNTDKGVKKLTLKSLKGRHATKGINLMLELAKGSAEEVDTNKLKEFLKYVLDTAAELCGLGLAEFEELEVPEQNKVLEYYTTQLQGRLDFMKSSLTVPNSVPKIAQV